MHINVSGAAGDFNPHHCISGDWLTDEAGDSVPISIHTTASVVTYRPDLRSAPSPISIHTTASVVTTGHLIRCFYFDDFNPHHCISGD